jgi:dienelactone hydrolase
VKAFTLVILAVVVTACSQPVDRVPITSSSTTAEVAATSTTVPTPKRLYRIIQTDIAIPLNDSHHDTVDTFVVTPIGRGPFPLIVFNHGLGSTAQIYATFLGEVARQGFVVAGPNFTNDDIHDDATEISRVIDGLTSAASSLAPGLVDPKHIAVLGHSFGGLTALAVTYNSCCRDRRISAALTFEGPVGDLPNGTYTWSGAPLLIVLGDHDPLVPPATGPQLFSKFRGTAYLLTIVGGDHGGGIDNTDPAHHSVLQVTLDFLNAYLKNDPTSLRMLRATPKQAHTRLAFGR